MQTGKDSVDRKEVMKQATGHLSCNAVGALLEDMRVVIPRIQVASRGEVFLRDEFYGSHSCNLWLTMGSCTADIPPGDFFGDEGAT